MTWNKVLAQDNVKNILQREIIEDRIPHAYCFWGDEGVGKEALALEFVKTVNCERPVIKDNSIEYCDVCNSCKMINSLSHPNLTFIFATPTPKTSNSENEFDNKQISEISEQLKKKSTDYYHKINVTGGTQIRVAAIRNLKKNLSKSATLKGRRVIIVSRAEELKTESANAFLKTLEEPHENVTIILTTSNKEYLLPTILSRCQMIHCPMIPAGILSDYLTNNYDITPNKAEIAASFAQGSLTRALNFINEDMQTLRLDCVDLLRTALTPREYKIKLSKKIDELTKDKNKRKIEIFLKVTNIWLRDIVVYRSTNLTETLVNIDQIDIFDKFIASFDKADLDAAIDVVETAYRRIRRNVPLNLLLINMYLDLRKTIYNT